MSFVAMAAQGVKLMKRLNNTHGDKHVLEHRLAIGSSYKTDSSMRVPFDELFTLGQPNSLTFLPQFGFEISNLTLGKNIISIKASLAVRSNTNCRSTNYRSNNPLPLFFPTIPLERCRLNVEATYNRKSAFAEVSVDQSSWEIAVTIYCQDADIHQRNELRIKCKLSGAVTFEVDTSYRLDRFS